MDLATITDIKELKVMAYDQSIALQLAQQNLQLIQQRIATLESQPKDKETAKKD